MNLGIAMFNQQFLQIYLEMKCEPKRSRDYIKALLNAEVECPEIQFWENER